MPRRGGSSRTTPKSFSACTATRTRDSVGITERAAQRIVADLIDSGYVESERVGRRNRYRINTDIALRHPAQDGHEVGELLRVLQLEND